MQEEVKSCVERTLIASAACTAVGTLTAYIRRKPVGAHASMVCASSLVLWGSYFGKGA